MSNGVDPTEEIERLGVLSAYDEHSREAERLALERSAKAAQDSEPRILMVDSHSPEARAIAEHLAFSRHENPDVIIVDEAGDWPTRVRDTTPTLDPQMLPKQLKNLDSVDPRVLEHRRYAARRKQRQALTKNQLKARRCGGIKGY